MSAFLRDARQNTFNVGSPGVQSGPALREKLVALVDSRNPRDRAGLVIEDLIGHVWSDTQTSHSGHTSPAQIMQPPAGHS